MTDRNNILISTTKSIPINYAKNCHGFSGSNNSSKQYLFELIIKGIKIGKKYFRNLEENNYSHLIKIDYEIPLSYIESYKVSLSLFPDGDMITYDLEGKINQDGSSFTHQNTNLYIEFTKNDNGYALCSCFYLGLDKNKIFASPPN